MVIPAAISYRENELIKMKLLILFLYILRNATVWVTLSLFKQIAPHVIPFLWNNKPLRQLINIETTPSIR